MPRARGSELPQRISPREGPSPLRTSRCDSDPLHNRPVSDYSPKIGLDRRSPRRVLPEPVNEKKLGTRIASLESQLEQAQLELKVLKKKIALTEATAKKETKKQLKKKATKPIASSEAVMILDKYSCSDETQESNHIEHEIPDENEKETSNETQESNQIKREIPGENKKETSDRTQELNQIYQEISGENVKETDVFEVPVEEISMGTKVELIQARDEQDELKPEAISITPESPEISVLEKPYVHELALKNDEIITLKAKMEETEVAVEACGKENESLISKLNEIKSNIDAVKAKDEKMASKLNQLGKLLEGSKEREVELSEKVKEVEGAKESIVSEMKKLRMQTEQWRKEADAAATILAEGSGRRISQRCGSMDKHYFGNVFEQVVGEGCRGNMGGSRGVADDLNGGFRSGKRKGSGGIRMFGDLWKKKGQK